MEPSKATTISLPCTKSSRAAPRAEGRGTKFPDIVFVDGEIGQLHAAEDALEQIGITDQPLASIAKREEWIYVYGREEVPIILDEFAPITHIVQTIRDEAHRFAVTFHRTRRNANRLTSELRKIRGLARKQSRSCCANSTA